MKLYKHILSVFTIFLFISCSNYGEKLLFDGTDVYYKDGITKDQATQLGNYLVKEGFTDGNSKSVQLLKNNETDHLVFKMVVDKGTAYNPEHDYMFNSFAANLNEEFNTPINFILCDNSFKSLKTYFAKDLPKTTMALKTNVLYSSAISDEEAQNLVDFLIKDGFANETSAKTIQIDKEKEVYLFKMVVKPGIEKSESNVAILKLFGASISQNVFNNDSLRVQMCDNKLQVIKDIK